MSRIKELITSRRSVREYLPDPVAPELIEEILHSALWAPSAHNRQPWRFCVLKEAEDKHQLASAMGSKLKDDRMRDGDQPHLIEADLTRSYQRITSAPVVIIAFATMIEMDRYPDPNRSQAEYLMAVQGTAMAIQNLLLSAHSVGLGGCWMCAPLFCQEIVNHTLKVPSDWIPQAIITLGVPKTTGKQKGRKDLKDVLWQKF